MRRGLPLLLLLATGCPPSGISGGFCVDDSDCGSVETCVFDLTRATSYCARRCEVSSDCPVTHECRTGVDLPVSGAVETSLCIDRVRECSDMEPCNGLDDDCDGAVDDGCAVVSNCLDDEPCGAFVCRAPDNQPSSLCAPPNTNATVASYDACTTGEQCLTGLCDTGTCSPLCRFNSEECLSAGLTCARAVGPRTTPAHNACQKPCESSAQCAVPQECVLRDVYLGPDSMTVFHAFVCSLPGPDRKGLGEPCSAHSLAGDDECAHGLCFRGVCTRRCEIGDRCRDVGDGFICQIEELGIGLEMLTARVCGEP